LEARLLFFAMIVAPGVLALAWILTRKARNDTPSKERLHRGTGHALLGLQQFIEPSVEYLVQAQNVEQSEDEDDQGLGADREAIHSGLADALGRTPVDPEEVRRHLAAARRLGMDWRDLFDQAVAEELRQRPFRAPKMPPAGRVAPRD
jgi:hypothetical protein